VNAVAGVSGPVRFKAAGTIDSYNSGPLAAPQLYSAGPSGNAGYSAVVVSQDSVSFGSTVRINDAVVNGYAVGYDQFNPSGTNWLSYGGAGKIVGPSTPPATYVDSSRLMSSPIPYQPVFAENLPTTWNPFPAACDNAGAAPNLAYVINQTSTLGNPASTIPAVYDVTNGIDLYGSSVLTIQGPVVLICQGSVSISATAQIQLVGPKASLLIFVESGSVSIGGNGINDTNPVPLAKRVAIVSTNNTSSTSTVTLSTTTPFYGVIYFPYLKVDVIGNPTIYGSIVGSQVTFTGSPTIHYDVALRTPDTNLSAAFGDANFGGSFNYLGAPVTASNFVASVP
jgi:hypothetical protein